MSGLFLAGDGDDEGAGANSILRTYTKIYVNLIS
jgi:hypothetical protein